MKTSYARKLSIFITCIALVLAAGSAAFAGTFTDLQNAINGASGTLTLTEDYTYAASTDAALSADGIIISKALTIDGGNKTVKALAKTRCFKVTASSADKVTFKNLTISEGGGKQIASGGGVYISEGSAVDFVECKIIANGTVAGVHTSDGGAALFVEPKANVNFTNCTIAENQGKDRSGGIYLKGNAVFTSCDVRDNVSGSRGGGIYVDPGKGSKRGGDWGGNVKMYNCTISGHKGGRGGGAYINPENDKLNYFENCTFTANDVTANSLGYGGGILFYCANAEMVNCKIISNKANRGGGIILDVASKVALKNCTIKDNQATVDGAGLYAFDGSHDDNAMKRVGTATFSGCTINGNVVVSGDVKTAQDISMNYTDEATAEARRAKNIEVYPPDGMVPESSDEYPFWTGKLWEARWDGIFTSGGKNAVGKVDFSSDQITMLPSDTWDGKPESSSSGCNAGFVALLLLAAVPFAFRKKK